MSSASDRPLSRPLRVAARANVGTGASSAISRHRKGTGQNSRNNQAGRKGSAPLVAPGHLQEVAPLVAPGHLQEVALLYTSGFRRDTNTCRGEEGRSLAVSPVTPAPVRHRAPLRSHIARAFPVHIGRTGTLHLSCLPVQPSLSACYITESGAQNLTAGLFVSHIIEVGACFCQWGYLKSA